MFIGFSNTGNIIKSDYCLFKNKNLTVSSFIKHYKKFCFGCLKFRIGIFHAMPTVLLSQPFQDGYIDAKKALITDTQQDCQLLQNDPSGFSFKRKFATCDPRDVVFSVS